MLLPFWSGSSKSGALSPTLRMGGPYLSSIAPASTAESEDGDLQVIRGRHFGVFRVLQECHARRSSDSKTPCYPYWFSSGARRRSGSRNLRKAMAKIDQEPAEAKRPLIPAEPWPLEAAIEALLNAAPNGSGLGPSRDVHHALEEGSSLRAAEVRHDRIWALGNPAPARDVLLAD